MTSTRRRRVAIAGLLVPFLLAVSSCSLISPAPPTVSSGVDPNARFPPIVDVSLGGCASAGAGSWNVSGKVHNPTPSPFRYIVTIELMDKKGVAVDSVEAATSVVKPAASAPWKVTSSSSPTTVTGCRVGSVYRAP